MSRSKFDFQVKLKLASKQYLVLKGIFMKLMLDYGQRAELLTTKVKHSAVKACFTSSTKKEESVTTENTFCNWTRPDPVFGQADSIVK
jgi:hypothetical protein